MENNIQYQRAKKRVKEMKGFYIHVTVFVMVNLLLFGLNFSKGSEIAYWSFLTPLLWGIGLLAHALSVFLPNFIFGKDWEERKIRQFMQKNR
ncbi:hypothetical protein ACM44_07345 [Chryseobacterium koreense CCUG 49689]|uniref:2TM domain-containing protein n=2 Tax=Chryseobacterium koreense TaxID=232216 RepID=A0A0J7J025_9FLAO|nr:hypothetical protein ACM44_07345 [Chryseobacterium koreense CCUG 49689]